MKHLIFVLIISIFSSYDSFSQIKIINGDTTINLKINLSPTKEKYLDNDTSLVKNFKLNFAVPDLPAFKQIGTEPSNLLRPSSSEIISLVTSNFLEGKTGVIPNAFAAELAPFMLLKANSLTLDEYDKNSILYSSRISVGTQLNEEQSSNKKMAIGARVTLIDKGDLKNDREYREKLYKLTADYISVENTLKKKWLQDNNKTLFEVVSDPELNNAMETYIKNESLNTKLDSALYYGKSFSERVEIFKNIYKEKNWNKQKLDIAVSGLWNSQDSLINNLKFQSFSSWITFANPLGKHGQLLIGSNFSNGVHDSLLSDSSAKRENCFSLTSRLYGGTNRIKGFIEAQYEYIDRLEQNSILLNAGCELNIKDGVWVDFSLGVNSVKSINQSSYTSNLVGNFNLRLTLPENFSLL